MIINRDTPECARCQHCSLIEPCTDSDVYFFVECRHMDRATHFETSINEDGCDCFSELPEFKEERERKIAHYETVLREIAEYPENMVMGIGQHFQDIARAAINRFDERGKE